jgi:UDP-GlcNAc:undecaprenyl-phosphate GlcNAc-1-phosphate transferase
MLVLFDLTCVAFFLSLALTPYVRDLSKRFHILDVPDQRRKIHAQPIPRMGGVAVAAAYVLTLIFIILAPYKNLTFDVSATLEKALVLLPAVGLVFIVGLIDDIRGLPPWQKLTGEAIAAAWAYSWGFGIYVLRGHVLADWVSLPVTILWLVGCANAVNLIDGMDGLAAGIGFFASLTMLVAALMHNSLELALVTAPLAGALLGFLRYNFNPASVFLGDSGSLLIGFLLGCYGAVWSQKSATILAMTAPLMALAIPLLDTGLAVARRFLRNQPLFNADRGHIHHQLLSRGFTPRRAALVLYAMCGVAAVLSLLQDMAHNQYRGLIVVLFCGAAWVGVQHLGYGEFGMASRLFFRGTLRGMVDVQLRLQQFEQALGKAESAEECWKIILAGCRDFGFTGARLSLHGQVFEERGESGEGKTLWQLRIPLADDSYANFFRALDSTMHPIVLTMFAQSVERTLQKRLVEDKPAVVMEERL